MKRPLYWDDGAGCWEEPWWNEYAGCWEPPPTEEECEELKRRQWCPFPQCPIYPCWEDENEEPKFADV